MAYTDSEQTAVSLNYQKILIFALILAAYFGSALLFWGFSTKALRSSVEAETKLSSSLLADDIHLNFPPETLLNGVAESELSDDLRTLEEKIGNDCDVYIIDAQGQVFYCYDCGSETHAHELALESLVALEESAESGASIRWIGKNGLLLLRQQCCVVRPLFGGRLYLVTLNHANSTQAQQRRQFTMIMVIDVLLMLVTMVLAVNAYAKYRRQMIRFATTDELTGLANRKSFNAEFAEFTAADTLPPFSLFLLDIDFFKQINDSFGHSAGDQALRYLAREIRALVKEKGGFAGRWGGDEFIGVLPLGGEEAHAELRALCRRIESAHLEDGCRMTISAGVVSANGETRLTRLSERADRALYASKEQGRNRASLYREEIRGAAPETGAGVARAEESAPAAKSVPAAPLPDERKAESFGARLLGTVRGKLIASTILGVRWMAPFVAGGGILIALAFLFDAASVDLSALSVAERAAFGSITSEAAALKSIGGITFNFMLPVFAGFMAYGIAGENAFMTGFVGGYMTINSNAGFIGAMIAGFAAGVITDEVGQFAERLPTFVRKAAPILIYPVFNLLLMQFLSTLLISPLSAAIGRLFTGLLEYCAARSSVSAGALSGMMMAVDMGGIINKVAYNYGVDAILAGRTEIMASVMIGGMVPPIGLALSVFLFPRKYTEPERERGMSALFMGLSFITEGALPYVFTDLGRVIPACMLGSALAGTLSALFGCTLPAPHGGMFVLPIMGRPFPYLLALAAGSLATAFILGLWKTDKATETGRER